jgi:hypothetical protein
MADLRLDGDIRNWVLIPITIAMFLVGVVRHNFGKLLKSDAKVDLKALREAQAVIRAERVRNNAGYIQSHGFRQRRHFFCHEVRGVGRDRGRRRRSSPRRSRRASDRSSATDRIVRFARNPKKRGVREAHLLLRLLLLLLPNLPLRGPLADAARPHSPPSIARRAETLNRPRACSRRSPRSSTRSNR